MQKVVPSTLQALHRFLTALKTSKNPLWFLAEKMETQRFSSLFLKAARGSIEPKSTLAAPTSFPAKHAAGGSRCCPDSLSEVVHLLQILITHLPSSINPGTANLTFGIKCFLWLSSLTRPSMSLKGQTFCSGKRACLATWSSSLPLGFSISVSHRAFPDTEPEPAVCSCQTSVVQCFQKVIGVSPNGLSSEYHVNRLSTKYKVPWNFLWSLKCQTRTFKTEKTCLPTLNNSFG